MDAGCRKENGVVDEGQIEKGTTGRGGWGDGECEDCKRKGKESRQAMP